MPLWTQIIFQVAFEFLYTVLALLNLFTIFIFQATTRLDALFKKLRSLNDRKEIYTNSLVNADLFYANFTNTTFQKEPRCMYLTRIPSLTHT